jgi:rhodanese-related sulfurtransferase
MVKGSRIWVFSLLLLMTVILAGCRAGSAVTAPAPGAVDLQTQKVPVEGGGSYTDVNAAGLAAMLEDKDFPLINVHIPYEGEIPDTDLFIPYNEGEANLGQLPFDKGAKVVLYCRSGGMSAIAARTLVQLGYTNVWNLDGGMIGWEQAGYLLLHEAQ